MYDGNVVGSEEVAEEGFVSAEEVDIDLSEVRVRLPVPERSDTNVLVNLTKLLDPKDETNDVKEAPLGKFSIRVGNEVVRGTDAESEKCLEGIRVLLLKLDCAVSDAGD